MEEKKQINGVSVILIILLSLILIGMVVFGALLTLGGVTFKVNKQESTQVVTTDNKVVEQNTKTDLQKANYSISEVTQINNYLKKIYCYYENPIPEFNNINSADEKWLWAIAFFNVGYNNFVKYSTFESSVKELYGPSLTKKLPKGELQVAFYDSQKDEFSIRGRGGNTLWPMYSITNIEKTSTGYNVSILEYVIDRTGGFGAEPEEAAKLADKIYLCKDVDSYGKPIKEFKVGDDNLIENYVIEHKADFNSKMLTLTQNPQTKQLYISSSKNIVK